MRIQRLIFSSVKVSKAADPFRSLFAWERTGLAMAEGVACFRPAERLVQTKPSIWVEFTALATECKAVNIGQGFPDSPVPQFVADILKDVSSHPERTDWHQYTRGFGHPRLVKVLAELYSQLLGQQIDAQTNVLITVGAYLSLYYVFTGWLNHGDEVIVLEPAYDCYVPQVRMAGGVPVPVQLKLSPNAKTSADYCIDLSAIERKISSRTKMIVLNNPHNPTGKLFTRKELEGIASIASRRNLLVVADEVYEWHVYPGHDMIRFASLPGMFERTITIGSAGKAFSVTGWKLGWSIAPAELLAPLKAVHQNCVFTCSTPTQEAVARSFERELEIFRTAPERSYLKTVLSSELVAKRDRMASMLQQAGIRPIIPDSGYFMMGDFSALDGPFKLAAEGDDPLDFRFVRWLCREKKLATIPPSAFYSDQFRKSNESMIRVCFFKTEKTLDEAEAILQKISRNKSA